MMPSPPFTICFAGEVRENVGEERKEVSRPLAQGEDEQQLCIEMEVPKGDKEVGGWWGNLAGTATKLPRYYSFPLFQENQNRPLDRIPSPSFEWTETAENTSSEESEDNSSQPDTEESSSVSLCSSETEYTAPEMSSLQDLRSSYLGPLGGTLITTENEDPGPWRRVSFDIEVPLNYEDFEGEKIVVHAELVYEWKDNKAAEDLDWNTICRKRKFLVYLCGGPGDGNPWDRNEAFNNLMLQRGYCILFPDYRGTGQSTPITAESLAARFPNEEARTTQQLVDYVSLFRQDNIVRDLEAMRQTIEEQVLYPGENLRFTLHGQSFGGWVALTYLSFLGREKHRIAEVFLTAGLAPITKSPELVYRALYGPITWANDHYYQVFKSDIDRVKYIFKTLDERGINYPLWDGTSRVLNAQMFMTLGRQFISGMDGMNKVHRFVGALFDHLKSQEGTGDTSIPATVLAKYAEIEGFKLHARPLYGILHESIYITGPGKASKWAAYRVGKHIKGYEWLNQDFKVTEDLADKLYFSGEMIYPFMMDSLESDLLREIAQEVAEKKDWPQIYDLEQLQRNDKPLRALVYPEDLAVNQDAGEETLARVGNSKSVVGPYHWEHGSLRTRTADVVQMLYEGRGAEWKAPVYGG